MELIEYLSQNQECSSLPNWLRNWNDTDHFDIHQFLLSDLVFYPGGWKDGQPIRVFNSACMVSCYLYADYSHNVLDEVDKEFNDRSLLGYELAHKRKIFSSELLNGYWVNTKIRSPMGKERDSPPIIGHLYIFNKLENKENVGGAQKVALLYLNIDAYEVFEKLLCEIKCTPPLAILLAYHGFGGNYVRGGFGGGGKLEELSKQYNNFPKWLLIATKNGTYPWEQYEQVPDVRGDTGGMHSNRRYLFRKKDF